MSSTVVTGIGELITNDSTLGDGTILGALRDAALLIEDGKVAWVGSSKGAPSADHAIEAHGKSVIPGFVDSHTHAVFGGDRVRDFVGRMTGEKYAAGGIKTTVAATREADIDHLRTHTAGIVGELRAGGITTFEIKSGYGLDVQSEAKILDVAKEFTEEVTFLGAHVVPAEFASERENYISLVIGEMLDTCAPKAKWIDVFCDTGAFTPEESYRILDAGIARGLLPRLHGNQLGHTGGVELALKVDAASVDHCTYLSDEEIAALASSSTIATLLPGAEFSTRSPYPDARRLYAHGAKVALATDCNPGTSFITSMPWVIATAVREMYFSPAQALHAATFGGAQALRRSDIGHLGIGARADFVILDAPSYEYLAYRPGAQLISRVIAAV
ncbi:MAG: imidazolonepropionase [Acidimicrobiia bacterium]|jgi:imidazolonepropionase|nr:imidazolonepropionase [Acidimicrobiia bacterium]